MVSVPWGEDADDRCARGGNGRDRWNSDAAEGHAAGPDLRLGDRAARTRGVPQHVPAGVDADVVHAATTALEEHEIARLGGLAGDVLGRAVLRPRRTRQLLAGLLVHVAGVAGAVEAARGRAAVAVRRALELRRFPQHPGPERPDRGARAAAVRTVEQVVLGGVGQAAPGRLVRGAGRAQTPGCLVLLQD